MACVNIRKCEVDGGDIQSGTVLSLKSVEGDGSKRPMCEVLVEGKKLVLMADSGSPWTIIVQDYFERMFEGIWDMTDLNESDIVAESFEGYMTDEFGSIKEEVWKDCEKNDDVIQEVKRVPIQPSVHPTTEDLLDEQGWNRIQDGETSQGHTAPSIPEPACHGAVESCISRYTCVRRAKYNDPRAFRSGQIHSETLSKKRTRAVSSRIQPGPSRRYADFLIEETRVTQRRG
ncbi:hypothetical protein NDU88_010729 [Pleurodeles waltl]|uniref:Uncharacterized protein n=1 Tax=Pleurodeles waltl TaxID=8319 RepID=A0AAV7S1N3_PLEWA|nr:hypothetical protein NDU88_010729 [Pleurodeles waltl]